MTSIATVSYFIHPFQKALALSNTAMSVELTVLDNVKISFRKSVKSDPYRGIRGD